MIFYYFENLTGYHKKIRNMFVIKVKKRESGLKNNMQTFIYLLFF